MNGYSGRNRDFEAASTAILLDTGREYLATSQRAVETNQFLSHTLGSFYN